MIKRLIGKELIEESLRELLVYKSIEEITVTEISKNCGISSRAFYNHFRDKHEAVGAIYLRYMKPYLDCSLDEWYEHMGSFFAIHSRIMENTLCYTGQNNLGDIIIELEWEKLRKHIKPEILSNTAELQRTEIAIEYMLCGNIGTARNAFVHKNQSAFGKYMTQTYGSTWEYLSTNIPPLILQNLSIEPIDPES